MNDVDKLRKKYQLFSDTTVPDPLRSRIHAMIEQYEPRSTHSKRVGRIEIFRSVGAAVAAVTVACFVVLRVSNPPGMSTNTMITTEGAGSVKSLAQSWPHAFLPYIVLLAATVVVLAMTWLLRKGTFAFAYRYRQMEWLSGQTIGVRWYDSVRLQTYAGVLFSWVMFAIFVAPSSTSPWVGVAAFLLFCAVCGSIRYFLVSLLVLLIVTIPAWWVAVSPGGSLASWYPMAIFNIAFFILAPGVILIPVRNALIRRLKRQGQGEAS